MKKFLDSICDKLQKPLSKMALTIGEIKFVQALSETFQSLVPILIVGAFGCLFYMMPFDWWQNFIVKCTPLFMMGMNIHMLSLFIFALYILVVLPQRYAVKLGLKEVNTVVPITLLTYLVLTPVDSWVDIPLTWIGQQGIISAMIISFLVPQIIKFLVNKNVRIKMPASVPQFVANGFSALIPAFVIVPIAAIIGYLMTTTSFGSIHNVIYVLIQKPLTGIGNSLFGAILNNMGACILFFFGIHASAITSIFEPLITAGSLENLAAWTANSPLPNICVGGFTSLVAGGGMIYASVAFLLFSKQKRYKDVAKFAVIPSLFGISEPIIFGIPLMLNMYAFIPYIITPLFNTIVSYILVATGILGRYTGVQPSFITPFILNQVITSTTPVRAAIWQVLQLGIDLIIWYPFVKMIDRQSDEETKIEGK